jgi:DNA (cytosine-5)-methyltransferase 1
VRKPSASPKIRVDGAAPLNGSADHEAAAAPLRYIDLFCGIGGFRVATERAARALSIEARCEISCDIDEDCQTVYAANFGDTPVGDIRAVETARIPEHDLLLAGFPCQPFSIIGHRKGFDDTRGTLFFEIARILEAKRPRAFVLENVKLLAGHDKGRTLARIMETLADLGYRAENRILNALNYGLPQKRERIFIVGFRDGASFKWPEGGVPMTPLRDILEPKPPRSVFASAHIRKNRLAKCDATDEPSIWHENKSGEVSAHPYSCALRAGASYNYLLVNGERRLTAREMLRLQGFPDTFKLVVKPCVTRKQAGNSVPVPVVERVVSRVLEVLAKEGAGKSASHPKGREK